MIRVSSLWNIPSHREGLQESGRGLLVAIPGVGGLLCWEPLLPEARGGRTGGTLPHCHGDEEVPAGFLRD